MTAIEVEAASEQERLAALRAAFPLLTDVAFFQTGSLAPLATPVRAAMLDTLDGEGERSLRGPDAMESFYGRQQEPRNRLAAFLGVAPAEIGWTSSTNLAIRHAIGSLAWRPGDRLLTTNYEHVSTRALASGLREHAGVETIAANAGDGPDQLLSELEAMLRTEPDIRLLLISHVSCQDGRRLPVEEAIRLAHERDVPVLVDAAQSLGQFPVDPRALGCDMLAGSAHKWLLGPAGLGFLYVASKYLDRFRPSLTLAPAEATGATLATLMEAGTPGLVGPAGLACALDLIDRTGVSAIEAHVSALTARLRTALEPLPGVTIVSPPEMSRQSGITSFTIDGYTHARYKELTRALWAHRQVMVKVQIEQPAIRVSIAGFNNDDDLRRLIDGITACALR